MCLSDRHIEALVETIVKQASAERDLTRLSDSELAILSELQAYIWQHTHALGIDRAELNAFSLTPFETISRVMHSHADNWPSLYRAMYFNAKVVSTAPLAADEPDDNISALYLSAFHHRLLAALLPNADASPHHELALMETLSLSPDTTASPDPAGVGDIPTPAGSPVQILNSKFQILHDSILTRWASELAPDGSWPGLPTEAALRRLRIFLLDRDQSVSGIDYPHLITAAFRYYSSLAISVDPLQILNSKFQIPLYDTSLLLDCYTLLPDRSITSLTPISFLLADYPDLTADTVGPARWLVRLLTLKAIVLQLPST